MDKPVLADKINSYVEDVENGVFVQGAMMIMEGDLFQKDEYGNWKHIDKIRKLSYETLSRFAKTLGLSNVLQKDEVVTKAIERIKKDIEVGDLTALEEFIYTLPMDLVIPYLSENE